MRQQTGEYEKPAQEESSLVVKTEFWSETGGFRRRFRSHDFSVPLAVLLVTIDDKDPKDPKHVRRKVAHSPPPLPAPSAAGPLTAWHPLFHRCPQGAAAAGSAGSHPAAGRREPGGAADAAMLP